MLTPPPSNTFRNAPQEVGERVWRREQGFRLLAPFPKTHHFFLAIRMLVWGLVALCSGVLRPAASIMAATSR
jgi:hypothetical protein